jgi:hypothetical protein
MNVAFPVVLQNAVQLPQVITVKGSRFTIASRDLTGRFVVPSRSSQAALVC